MAYTYGIKGDASFYNLCPNSQGGKLTENKSIFGDAFNIQIPQPQAVPSELQAVLSLAEWQAFLDGVAACEASSMPGSALQAFYWFPVLGCITGIALMSCFNQRLLESYEAFSAEQTKKGIGGGQVLFRARRLNGDGKEAASFQAIEICFVCAAPIIVQQPATTTVYQQPAPIMQQMAPVAVQQASQRMAVQATAPAGSQMTIMTPDGRTMSVIVPQGVCVGMTFECMA